MRLKHARPGRVVSSDTLAWVAALERRHGKMLIDIFRDAWLKADGDVRAMAVVLGGGMRMSTLVTSLRDLGLIVIRDPNLAREPEWYQAHEQEGS